MSGPLSATLIGHGRLSWAETLTVLHGCICVWSDLDGMHCEAAPTDPPMTSHLWGWEGDRLLRARVDGPGSVLAELRMTYGVDGTQVQIVRYPAASWPPNEGRVSVADRWRGRPITLYQVVGLMPLSFARLDD